MESVLKVGRTLGGGVCRAAELLAKGARRILAAVPFLGYTIDEEPNDDTQVDKSTGGEETEAAAAATTAAATPDDKSTVSSPTEESKEAKDDKKDDAKPTEDKPAATTTPATPAEEPVAAKKEEPVAEAAAAAPEKKVESAPKSEAAAVENKVATENGIADDAPKSPPPAVPIETTQPAPAITEDVASVTKAIEEIDISEKAVAAAVNENIESAGANEIVADSVHE